MAFRISDFRGEGPTAPVYDFVGKAKSAIARVPALFFAIVVVPIVLAAVYYLVLASPVYVSQAKFIVRASQQPQASALGGLLQGVGLSPAETDSFAVQDYIMSRDAIEALVRADHLREALGPPGADILSRFPGPLQADSIEELAKAYPRFVSVDYNSSTGISTLTVRAFRSQDARDIAAALLMQGEEVVNRLNDRAEGDAISETNREIVEAETQLSQAEQHLTAFRNREQLIDPARSSTVSLELLGKIEADLATLEAERAGIAASAPHSAQLPILDDRIHAYQAQAQAQRAAMAGQTGSLAPLIGEYERLSLERDFADKALGTAAASAEDARLEARRKKLYLERVVNPTLPDSATEPDRVRSLIVVSVSAILAYLVITLLIVGFREHRQS